MSIVQKSQSHHFKIKTRYPIEITISKSQHPQLSLEEVSGTRREKLRKAKEKKTMQKRKRTQRTNDEPEIRTTEAVAAT